MNLTQTAQFTKRAVAALTILLSTLTIGRATWKIGAATYRHFVPPQKPPPEVEFGKLPSQEITALEVDTSNWTYTLDTPTERLPPMPDRLPVFPLTKPPATPLTEQRAKVLAKSLGFTSLPQALAPNKYRWSDDWRTLEMNIVSQNFSLNSNLNLLEIHLPLGTAPSRELAEREALSFLSRLNLANPALNGSQKEAIFVRIHEGTLEKVESASQAQLTRIDLYKIINIDNQNYRVLGPRPKEGLTQVLVAGRFKNPNDRFSVVNYQNWEIKTDGGSTYPLLTPMEAWKKIENNEAMTVYLKPQKANPYQTPPYPKIERVRIQEMFLAYFEAQSPQKYLLPVFVFEGLAEASGEEPWKFIAYLPAVRGEWLEE